jgi:hypothetical protein
MPRTADKNLERISSSKKSYVYCTRVGGRGIKILLALLNLAIFVAGIAQWIM